jgi:hypothetical protein
MKRFRVICEIDCADKKSVEKLIDPYLPPHLKHYPVKIQTIRGKRKPKPNPNQLDLEGVYESAQKMQDRINKRIQDKIDNTGLEA